MNLTNRLGSPAAGARSVGLAVPPPSPALARVATIAFLAVAFFVVAGAVGLGLYASTHAGRIY